MFHLEESWRVGSNAESAQVLRVLPQVTDILLSVAVVEECLERVYGLLEALDTQ